MLTVQPPKPPPVIRDPITPGIFHASSTSTSTSGPVSYTHLPDWLQQYNELFETSGITDTTFVTVLYSVILAPICEELIFRGVTMRLSLIHIFRYYNKKIPLL